MRLQEKKCVKLWSIATILQYSTKFHNSHKSEKLNIFIVCYITNHQNSWISKFILPITKTEAFFWKHHFSGKIEISLSFDWDLNFFNIGCFLMYNYLKLLSFNDNCLQKKNKDNFVTFFAKNLLNAIWISQPTAVMHIETWVILWANLILLLLYKTPFFPLCNYLCN